ncbi:protein of unknown function [Candidatus Methylomirabilis oxygeniifera]|uniref:HIT domain-containing protein n=1 Tax=Methylomirabilis oxygeniifera TaxID=671143 RepID=D5MJS7_METO1|nr:protein of unknown function [Candidatus Methylomirabilis oxyfera]
MGACKLCSELESRTSAWNQPLFESPNFVALPSLGALIEGWILLVPKRHFISFGAVPGSMLAEMNEFKGFLCSVLGQRYGTATAFEHGPIAAGRTVGCGVDHAHLHLVPLLFDLLAEVSPLLPSGVRWANAGIEECQDAYGRGQDYLYLEQPICSGWIATHDQFGSQLFRRAIATRIGVRDQYNWREYEQLPTVMATMQMVRALVSTGAADGLSGSAA